jgi:hypothetical protein
MNDVTFPDGPQPVVIADDAALETITRLGVLEQLAEERYLAAAASILFYSIHGHKSHWILVGRFCGFERQEENGYIVMAWLKSLFPASVMDDEMALYSKQPLFKKSDDLPRAKERNNN